MAYTTSQLEAMLASATPGPWQVSGVRHKGDLKIGNQTRLIMVGPDCDYVAGVFFDMQTGRGHTDAKLLAAAPEVTAELIAARRKLEWVQGLVEAATALLVQVDGLIPIKHPQQKLERNKLRHAITAVAMVEAFNAHQPKPATDEDEA